MATPWWYLDIIFVGAQYLANTDTVCHSDQTQQAFCQPEILRYVLKIFVLCLWEDNERCLGWPCPPYHGDTGPCVTHLGSWPLLTYSLIPDSRYHLQTQAGENRRLSQTDFMLYNNNGLFTMPCTFLPLLVGTLILMQPWIGPQTLKFRLHLNLCALSHDIWS